MNVMANTTLGELSDITFTYVPRDYIAKKRLTKEITAQKSLRMINIRLWNKN